MTELETKVCKHCGEKKVKYYPDTGDIYEGEHYMCTECNSTYSLPWEDDEATNQEKLDKLKAKVEEQANDEGLWFIAATAPEAYLQKALRELHFMIEGNE